MTACLLILLSACAPKSVVITKGSVEEREGVKGSCVLGLDRHSSIHQELCQKDLPEILKGSKLTDEEQRTMYGFICEDSGQAPEKIRAFYEGLSVEKRLGLMRAFERRGYYFNAYG